MCVESPSSSTVLCIFCPVQEHCMCLLVMYVPCSLLLIFNLYVLQVTGIVGRADVLACILSLVSFILYERYNDISAGLTRLEGPMLYRFEPLCRGTSNSWEGWVGVLLQLEINCIFEVLICFNRSLFISWLALPPALYKHIQIATAER